MSIIRFENVTKYYTPDKPVLKDLSVDFKAGDFITVIGSSGCGKTTFLKLINGLIQPDEGKIFINNDEISALNPIELRRSIGYVIQQTGLFPHMTIEENISYVLNIKGEDKTLRNIKAKQLINFVGMSEDFLTRYPHELSGGQRQRIGVARALAGDPDIILMDEPFGAVDGISRSRLQGEILKIHSKLNKTIFFVTHDIEEAMRLGTKIVLLNNGRIEQAGNRIDMIFKPKTEYVKRFFGLKNFMAYLLVEKIKTVEKQLTEEEFVIFQKRDVPFIERDAPILEGIKLIFEYSEGEIGVMDSEGKLSGKFSISGITHRFNM